VSCLPERLFGGRQTITLDQDAVGVERGDGEDGDSRPSERVQDRREDSGQRKWEWPFEPRANPNLTLFQMELLRLLPLLSSISSRSGGD